jgi:hypothetical protein
VSTADKSYVVFGHAGAFAPGMNLNAIDGSNGFALTAGAANSTAGDVNGDGFTDFIVGLPGASAGGTYSGAAYVVFGKEQFSATVDVFTLDGRNGFRSTGPPRMTTPVTRSAEVAISMGMDFQI